ncbi:hypothetical protein JOM56_010594 [Amanita muscaria]
MDFDTAWCPVCDRQIIPKRIQVPVPPPPPAPGPPPPSPHSSSPNNNPNVRRTKGGTIKRANAGLAQGTGRVKPNGSIKVQSEVSKPAHPVKFRTVIDQTPIPLYCSDECRLADLYNHNRGLPLNPARATSPRPSQTFAASETESDSTASSVDSVSSDSSSASKLSPSMATLAAIYRFPPAPPAAPVLEESSSSDSELYHDYTSGIMMAARFIGSVCPKPAKRSSCPYPQPAEPPKPVPGWTDGTNAWRSSVYSFSSPKKTCDPLNPEESTRAYRSFAASSHRSQGVYSTVGQSEVTPRNSSAASLPTASSELIQKYSQSFNRRSESRSTINNPGSVPTSPTSTHSFPATMPTSPRRERPIVPRQAEGKLLVPDVKIKVHSGSSTSLSSAWSSRKSLHSPLSITSSDSSDDEVKISKRPVVETRSWSYENFKTYSIMPVPAKKEKKMEKHIVDGQEVVVEVEVEVEQPLKRLFLFPPSLRPT